MDRELRAGVILLKPDALWIRARGTRDGAQVVQPIHGSLYEGSLRAFRFCASTDARGVVVSSRTGGAGASFVLRNPPGSGAILSFDRLTMAYLGGTSTPGCLYHVIGSVPITLQSGGTALTPNCSLVGGITSKAIVKAAVVGGSIPGFSAVPTVYRPFGFVTAQTSAVTSLPGTLVDELNGEIVLYPGNSWGIQLINAGGGISGATFGIGLVYEEIPMPTDGS